MSSVVLNMIVKDEAHVITRTLLSCKPHIDSYIIVDTGSTDRTKDVIRDVLKDTPGEIIDRPWKDFGHNRTEALELARGKADYTLVMDADDELIGAKPINLVHNEYHVLFQGEGGCTWPRPLLFKSNLPYRYEEPIHEFLVCDVPNSVEQRVLLQGLRVRCYPGQSARARDGLQTKFLRDAELLEKLLREEPNHRNRTRRMYYLGQCYHDAGVRDKAIDALETRARCEDGHPEETFAALMHLAAYARDSASADPDEIEIRKVEQAYMRAFNFRPTRLEPISDLCHYFNECQKFQQAYTLAKPFLDAPMTKDLLLVDRSVWDWSLKAGFATAAASVGDFYACKKACIEIVRRVPHELLRHILNNIRYCEEQLRVRQGGTGEDAAS